MSTEREDYMNREEIDRNVGFAEQMLANYKGADPDPETALGDIIANLLILGQERDFALADIVQHGITHFCTTYIEGMEPDEAYEWLNATLFPFTGEREFVEYAADQAIILAGLSGKVQSPEWGV